MNVGEIWWTRDREIAVIVEVVKCFDYDQITVIHKDGSIKTHMHKESFGAETRAAKPEFDLVERLR